MPKYTEREFVATRYKYTKWKPGLILQKPTYGSKWYIGNFTIGLMVDSHPRYVHIILGLWFVEFGVFFSRDVQWEEEKQ